MSEQMNYMQRVGHSKCVRCDFETSDDMTFEQQDAAMMAHLADKHPNWMTDGIKPAEPSPGPEAAPAPEAQAPAVPDGPIDHRRNCPAWTNAEGYEVNGEDCTCGKRWRIDIQTLHELKAAWEKRAYESEAEVASLREKLARAKAGWDSAIADLKTAADICRESESELAQLRARVAILDAQEVELPELKPYRGWLSDATRERERQLLDALRAIQVWREAARKQNEALKFLAQEADGEISPATFELANSAIAAYDALAGKGE